MGAELAEKIMGNLVAHVKADGVDAIPPDPALTQADEIFLYRRVVGVELGHSAVEGEGEIPPVPGVALDKGPLTDKKPVPVR